MPELVGCVTHGDSYEQAVEQAKDAMAVWVAGETAMGRPIPLPRTYDAYAPARA